MFRFDYNLERMEDIRYIVYVDDDPEDQETLTEVVAEVDSRLKVVTVDSGEDLLNYLDSLSPGQSFPCLVLLDMNMPKMNGIETLRELKSHKIYNKLTVIMFSTSDNPLSMQMVREIGAADYIRKPVTYQRFLQVASQFIDLCHTVPEIKNQ